MRIRSLLVAACSIAALAMPATAQDRHATPQPAVSAMSVSALPAPMPNPAPLAPLSLLGFALMGATTESKTKKVNLNRSYTFGGLTYGPGTDIEVPNDFPEIDGESGLPIHPPGSAAARNMRRSTMAANTGGVNTGEPPTGNIRTVSGKTAAELDAMSKAELVELAESKAITVARADGEEGDPLKGDYVKALSASTA